MTRFLAFRPLALALGAALLLSACDATIDDADTADLTAAEADEAAQIVADALAEDGGGLFATTDDLTASVTADSMTDGPFAVRGYRDDRGPDRRQCRNGDYRMTYDEETGTHLVTYRCRVETDNLRKSYATRLTYQYRDADGGFVPRPAENWDTVGSVAFGGTREGSIRIQRGDFVSESAFEQTGEWMLSELADDATPALLSGRQVRNGTRVRTGPGGSGSRDFSVELSGTGIELREGEDGLGRTAVGELAYLLTLEITRNGQTVTRTVEGTVVLEDSSRALVRIIGLPGVYRVSLGDGETDRDG